MAVLVFNLKMPIENEGVMITPSSGVFDKNGFNHVHHVLTDIQDCLSILIDVFPLDHRNRILGVFFKKLAKHVVAHLITEILEVIHFDTGFQDLFALLSVPEAFDGPRNTFDGHFDYSGKFCEVSFHA